ncbi:MAG: protein translocase subunit SecF [bacterium]|nr:protein translocase subunit SecF [bacterium]
MLELIKNPKINFIGKRYHAFIISGVLCLLGIIAVIFTFIGKANLGVDFAGGSLVQVKFQKPVAADVLRKALISNNLADSEIQQVAEGNRVLIRTRKQEVVGERVDERIRKILAREFEGNRFILEGIEYVGPKIGGELREKALWAIFWAIIAMMIYIAFRFDFRFGIAAAIATLHDVLVVYGIIWLSNREVTLLTISALLTLAGYSLTDTVIVFDRIRENLKLRRKEVYDVVINSSINEVLSRTIVTSVTVLIVLLALIIRGSQVTFDFCLVLLIGVIVGTYSSVFVASPILVEWHLLATKKVKSTTPEMTNKKSK